MRDFHNAADDEGVTANAMRVISVVNIGGSQNTST